MLNERLFDDGAIRTPVPLLSAVAASNEGPDSDELAALYDRFLLRKLVRPVSDDGILRLLIGDESSDGASVATKQSGSAADTDVATASAAVEEADVSLDPASLRVALADVRAAADGVVLPRWAALLLRDARARVGSLGAEGFGGGCAKGRI